MLTLFNALWLIVFLFGIATITGMHLYKKRKGRQFPHREIISFSLFYLLILLSALIAFIEEGWSQRIIMYILLLALITIYAVWKVSGRKNRS
ncbi:hypothetical protein [Virgibacillus sediminis]|uniref:Uncharacterized protein n=1 Tax=Virgibacillus sediminis TaxID=202260 RepID=A0ABV7A212_9BACI